MAEEFAETSSRKPRADAIRNRERILAVAREAFSEAGASVTLDDIVQRSGLGVGTLYRHFPTRDALVEALYLAEMERLATAQRELSESLAPVEALRQWMLLFIDLLATKEALRDVLNSLVGGTDKLYATSGDLVKTAIHTLTDNAVASGEIRLTIEPLDLLRALAGVSNTSADPQWVEGARRLVDLLIAGLRTPETK